MFSQHLIVRLISVIILLLFQLQSFNVQGKVLTIYDGYCDSDILYKPYLKYYRGRLDAFRNGIPFKKHSPGFHADFLDEGMENTYICINGMAWLYYRITTLSAAVYETPELHAFVHHCMLVNGIMGPSMNNVERKLLGILLLGHKKDYRQPSIELLTAPYQPIITPGKPGPPPIPPVLGETYNATSIMMFGDDTECILKKGRKNTEVRIRTESMAAPPPPYDGTFCRLSYQNAEKNIPSTGDKNYVEAALKHDEQIKIKGCYVPDLYTDVMTKRITDRLAQIDTLDSVATGSNDPDLLKATHNDWFEKPDRLPTTTTGLHNPAESWPADECQWATLKDCEPDEHAKKLKDAEDKLEAAKKADPQVPDDIKREERAVLQVKLKMCRTNAFTAKQVLGSKTSGLYQALIADWTAANTQGTAVNTAFTALKVPQDAVNKALDDWKKNPTKDNKKLLDDAVKVLEPLHTTYKAAAIALTPIVSKAESGRLKLEQQIHLTFMAYTELVSAFKAAVANGAIPKCATHPDIPLKPDVITIKRVAAEYLTREAEDPTRFVATPEATCGLLPNEIDECKNIKPTKQRSGQLLNARMGKFITIPDTAILPVSPVLIEWKPEDVWRKDVLQIMEDIFVTACSPMLKRDFSVATGRIIRGYLTDMIIGTIARQPSPGTGPIDLPKRRPFWDQIMKALEDCKKQDIMLKFRRFMNGEKEDYKFVKKNADGSNEEVIVEHFIEQADNEYAFNYVIDSHWRIFATVLGVCMPAYEKKMPQISTKFFNHYTEDFFDLFSKEWIMGRDNFVFKHIMGEYYSGIGEQWSSLCMEASFIQSGDIKYRPARKLLVNGLTEPNFFTSGPLSGTAGMYSK